MRKVTRGAVPAVLTRNGDDGLQGFLVLLLQMEDSIKMQETI